MTTLNSYKAFYEDLNERFVVAASMEKALTLLAEQNSTEPAKLAVVAKGVYVAAEHPDVQLIEAAAQGTEEEVSVVPSKLTSVTRGDTVYFVCAVPDGYVVKHWLCNGNEISDSAGASVLRWAIPVDDITAYSIVCVLEASTTAPDPISDFSMTIAENGCSCAWTNPTSNYKNCLVTVQKALDLSFVHSDVVEGEEWSCDDLDAATNYIIKVFVVGKNNQQSTAVGQQFKTADPVIVQPASVTDASVSVANANATISWALPATTPVEIDHIKVVVKKADVTVDTKECVASATNVVLTDLVNDEYTAEITTVTSTDVESEAVTVSFTIAVPAAPNNFTATVSGTHLELSWAAPTDTSNVAAYVCAIDTEMPVEVASTDTTATIDISSLSAGEHTAKLWSKSAAGATSSVQTATFTVE